MTREKTPSLFRPVFTAVQLVPLLKERKTPPRVPAYRVVGTLGFMIIDVTDPLVRPVFTAVQLVPLLKERKTPPRVPAYKVVGTLGLIARDETY
jgi:hypothetical protein